MAEPLFRKEALSRLQSPEQADQALRVLSRKDWFPLAVLGGLVFVAGVWSVVGSIPITAQGQAILVTLGSVVPFESSSPGQIRNWLVRPGDTVTKDQRLAELDQPEITSDLEQARERREA